MLNSQMSYAELSSYLEFVCEENRLLGAKELSYIQSSLQDAFLQRMLIRYPLSQNSQNLVRDSFERERFYQRVDSNGPLSIHGSIYGVDREKILTYLEQIDLPLDIETLFEKMTAFIKEVFRNHKMIADLEEFEMIRYEQRLHAYQVGDLIDRPSLQSIDQISDDYLDYLEYLKGRLQSNGAQASVIISALLQRLESITSPEERSTAQTLLLRAFDASRTTYHDKSYCYIRGKDYSCLQSLEERLLDFHANILTEIADSVEDLLDRTIFQLTAPFIEKDFDFERPIFSQALYKLYLTAAGYGIEQVEGDYFELCADYNLKAFQEEYLHALEQKDSSILTSVELEKLEAFLDMLPYRQCEVLEENYHICIIVLSEMGRLKKVNRICHQLIPPEVEKSDDEIAEILYEIGPFIDRAHFEMIMSLHHTCDSLDHLRSAAEVGIVYNSFETLPSREEMIQCYQEYLFSIKARPFHHFIISTTANDIFDGENLQEIRCSQRVFAQLLEGCIAELKKETAERLAVLSAKSGYATALRILCQPRYVSADYFDSQLKLSLLSIAAMGGYTHALLTLIELNATLNDQRNVNRMTALLVAVSQGHLDIVRLLVNAGSDVNLQTELGATAVIAAVRLGYMHTLGVLLAAQPNLDLSLTTGETALILAAQSNYHQAVKMLLDAKATLNLKTNSGISALMCAAGDGAMESLEYLIAAAQGDIERYRDDLGDGLILAAQNGRIEATIALLKAGANINAKDADGNTSLLLASYAGHVPIVRVLIAQGADLDFQDKNGSTPLILAAYMGHEQIATELIAAGAKINLENSNGNIPLHLAVSGRHVGIINKLIQARSLLNFQELTEGLTPLMLAAHRGYQDVVESLLQAGANLDVHDMQGNTALYLAVKAGHAQIARVLLDKGSNLRLACNKPAQLLFLAASSGYCSVIEVLRDHSAVRMQDIAYYRALKAVIESGETSVINILIASWANINFQDDWGDSILHWAAIKADPSIIKKFLEAKAAHSLRNKQGVTPLLIAVERGHLEGAELLIRAGADVNLYDNQGYSALTLAALKGHFNLINMLIDSGANVNYQEPTGDSAAIIAASKGYLDIVKALYAADADLDLVNKNGESASIAANNSGHLEIVEILIAMRGDKEKQLLEAVKSRQEFIVSRLLARGACPNAADEDTTTALMYAAAEGRANICRLLIDAGAQVDLQNKNGGTALMRAALAGFFDIVYLLIDSGANINFQNKLGYTALIIAISHQHQSVAQFLIRAGADLRLETIRGDTALMFAAQTDCYQVIRELVLQKVPLGAKNKNGKTALTIAIDSGNMKAQKILMQAPDEYGAQLITAVINNDLQAAQGLLRAGANIDYQDSYAGNTALMYAVIEGHNTILNMLLYAKACIDIKNTHGQTAKSLAELEFNAEGLVLLMKAERQRQPGTEAQNEGKSLSCLYDALEQQDFARVEGLRHELVGRAAVAPMRFSEKTESAHVQSNLHRGHVS